MYLCGHRKSYNHNQYFLHDDVLTTASRRNSIEAALIIICGCIPTTKPIYDYFRKGTPVRPFRSGGYPSKRSYQMHSSTKDSGTTNLVSTNVTSNGMELGERAVDKEDAVLGTSNIRVKQEVEIDGCDRHSRDGAAHGV